MGSVMKPNFALSLSVEGICLLHRAAGGWRLVGEVPTDAPDMADRLSVLRRTATSLARSGLRSKVIVPNDQIRWMSIETGNVPLDERRALAAKALEAATPYTVSDLAFDIAADGGTTHIAAVAKKTLDEAEAFAVQHRFHPMSSVAIPGDEAFLGEPFFGPTDYSQDILDPGDKVEADGIAVVIIGPAEMPDAPVLLEGLSEESTPFEHPPIMDADVAAPTVPMPDDTPPPPVFRTAPEIEEPAAEAEQIEEQQELAVSDEDKAIIAFASRRSGRTPEAAADPAPDIEEQVEQTTEPEDEPAFAAEQGDEIIEIVPPAGTVAFLGRRQRPSRRGPVIQKPPVIPAPPLDEAERLTVFGARKRAEQVPERPRVSAGLVISAFALVFLAGVAGWASVFLDEGLARFFAGRVEPVQTVTAPEVVAEAPATTEDEAVDLAAISPTLSDEDAAVLDAMRNPRPEPQPDPEPQAALPTPTPELSDAELEAQFPVTGIWPFVPAAPRQADLVSYDAIYETSIDRDVVRPDPVALPAPDTFSTDGNLPSIASPAPPGTAFTLDDDGLVEATPEGALSPDGHLVYRGRPEIIPPDRPVVEEAPDPDADAALLELAAFRPQSRPGDLVEQNERARLGGLSAEELRSYRPKQRPGQIQTEIDAIVTDVALSQDVPAGEPVARPVARPSNYEELVGRALPQDNSSAGGSVGVAAPTPQTRPEAAPREERRRTVRPATVQPRIPSSTSVTREATVKNAINLNRVNLIGVYGQPSERRALVRLSNGRYQKVKVGDRLDGGRVSAIGDSELRYRKGGRNLVLRMPTG